MAFSADELRVLRRALAEVLHSGRAPAGAALGAAPAAHRPVAEHVQDYLGLAEAVDDAVRESERLHAFLLAELRHYREALPGAAVGYPERLTAAVESGRPPGAEDLAALRLPHARAAGSTECHRRTALLRHCEHLAAGPADRCENPADNPADNDVRPRLEAHMPAPRRLLSLPGTAADSAADSAAEPGAEPGRKPVPTPAAPPAPGAPEPADPEPGRRTPTPAEIWPPGRRPVPRPGDGEASAALVGPRRAC